MLYLSGSQLAEMNRRLFVRCAGRRSYVQKKSLSTVKNTSQTAYGMIVRERRHYFRYSISVPAAVSKRSPKWLICIVEIASVLLFAVGLLAAAAD
jgi:hypothetical protein